MSRSLSAVQNSSAKFRKVKMPKNVRLLLLDAAFAALVPNLKISTADCGLCHAFQVGASELQNLTFEPLAAQQVNAHF